MRPVVVPGIPDADPDTSGRMPTGAYTESTGRPAIPMLTHTAVLLPAADPDRTAGPDPTVRPTRTVLTRTAVPANPRLTRIPLLPNPTRRTRLPMLPAATVLPGIPGLPRSARRTRIAVFASTVVSARRTGIAMLAPAVVRPRVPELP
ncbi:hypothetical protein [Nocardia sp.]|uniref:hypothetical protein n=1 Tax=Nocardia sp. TaxID=1821 RepID=UPI002630026F|nr:hypothetical protein [Nocardia sp.]